MNLRDRILAAALDRAGSLAHDIRDAINDNANPAPGLTPCEAHAEAEDSPAYREHTWRIVFASEAKTGDLIAMDGRHYGGKPGRHALRITALRESEHQLHPLSGAVPMIACLFVDLDSGESDQITMSRDAAVEVAVEVPDSVPADLGEQR